MSECTQVVPTPEVSVVIPVHNRVAFVRQCLAAVTRMAREHGGVEIIVVDHSSTDGAYETALAYGDTLRVLRLDGGTISAVRNLGARYACGQFLAFIDSDCLVAPGYFRHLLRAFEETGAAVVGSECGLPEGPHWSERVWHDLHVIESDGERHYLNGANLAIRRDVFEQIHGFDETAETGEDTELCNQVRAAGHRIYEVRSIQVAHLGNPKSLRDFFRKQVWHGLGIFTGRDGVRLNKIMLLVFLHGLAFSGIAACWLAPFSFKFALLMTLVLPLLAPAAAVIYRTIETRRLVNPLAALALYFLYLSARVTALVRVVVRRAVSFGVRSRTVT